LETGVERVPRTDQEEELMAQDVSATPFLDGFQDPSVLVGGAFLLALVLIVAKWLLLLSL
jgi:hypothetical protein